MKDDLSRAFEALVLVAVEPVSPMLIAELLEVPVAEVEAMAAALQERCRAEERGFELGFVAGGYRFQTSADLAEIVQRFANRGVSARLSTAALETLAIVAYRQPVSRAQIANLRGVNADGVVKLLESRGYIEVVGRAEGPGQPILYGTTEMFLERLGLFSLNQLPPVEEFLPGVEAVAAFEDAMRGVDYVFHAAALKQVPSCEFYPMEAVRTNVLGTENVLRAAITNSVGKVVVLSTDKAVYPINAMGISKAMAEKIVVAKSRITPDGTPIICATRYGNVMASRGSVIPLFVNQIKKNLPITITDPKMTRFLMTLDDSVDLVLHAFQHANPGDIFVQKSPASTVADLAQAMIELFHAENKIQTIGTRHGEKLYESLVSREEMAKAEDLGKYYRIPADNRDLNYKKYFVEGEEMIADYDDYTSHNTQQLTVQEIKDILLRLDSIQEAFDA